MSTGTSCHFCHLLQVLKKKISLKSDFMQLFFMILYMYIAPEQGQTGNKVLMSTEMSCHFIHLMQVFKTNAFEVGFYTICFMIYYMYIAPGQGQTAPRGQNLDVNRKALSLYPFVASFKEISFFS